MGVLSTCAELRLSRDEAVHGVGEGNLPEASLHRWNMAFRTPAKALEEEKGEGGTPRSAVRALGCKVGGQGPTRTSADDLLHSPQENSETA